MVTFSLLEKKGNLGNQLFQISSIIGIASKNNHSFSFPEWKYSDYFKYCLPVIPETDPKSFKIIKEKKFSYSEFKLEEGNFDFDGWFQSEKYFNIDLTKHYFCFKDDLIENLNRKYKEQLNDKTIIISIRRGDFVDHPDYFQLSIDYYFSALLKYFPDWQSRPIFILSDDIEYIRFHFKDLQNCFFSDNLSPIEQLALSTQCKNFIISNSTFSWWCAWLGEKSDSKIVRPEFYFTSEKRQRSNEKDYFPTRWNIHKNENLKIDFKNINLVLAKNDIHLINYYEKYFSFNKKGTPKSADLKILGAFIPPIVLFKCLQSNTSCKIYSRKILFISKREAIKYLSKQYDFGFFSSVFNKKLEGKYLIAELNVDNQIEQREVVIYLAGKKSYVYGNRYFFNREKRLITKKIKLMIKRILCRMSKQQKRK
jgi:hypothetical protein